MRTPFNRFGCKAFILSVLLAATGRADPAVVEDADGHFAATFPAAVSRSNQIIDMDAGQVILCRTYAAQGAEFFTVIYCDYPEGYVASTGAAAIYKDMAKDAADKAKGTIRSQGDCKLGDVAGLEVLIDGPNRVSVERMRLYVVGDRLFQVTFTGRPNSEAGKDAQGFLDSFRLLPVPAPK
jgi:hypothetical protein